MELMAPCHFGLESVLKRELTDLNLEVTTVSDGRVSFKGDERALVTASCSLRPSTVNPPPLPRRNRNGYTKPWQRTMPTSPARPTAYEQ